MPPSWILPVNYGTALYVMWFIHQNVSVMAVSNTHVKYSVYNMIARIFWNSFLQILDISGLSVSTIIKKILIYSIPILNSQIKKKRKRKRSDDYFWRNIHFWGFFLPKNIVRNFNISTVLLISISRDIQTHFILIYTLYYL